MGWKRKEIALDSLLLDIENARHGEQDDQNAVLKWMVTGKDRSKLRKLAQDIAQNGPSPLDLPAVIPAGNRSSNLFIVVEGNRRITAMKLLADPEKCPDPRMRKQFQKMRQELQAPLPSSLECVVFPDLKAATPWIERRHLGEQGGAGTVNWGAKEIDFFARRTGQRGRYDPGMRLLEYAVEEKLITQEESNKIPLTNVTRVINTPTVRRDMGIDLRKGQIFRVADPEYANTAIGDVLRALMSDKWTVSKLKNREQREGFIKELKEKGNWGTYRVGEEVPLTNDRRNGTDANPPSDQVSSGTEGTKRRMQRDSLARTTPISSETRIRIKHKRLRSIFRELASMNCDDHSNAAWVLTRVFIEGCVDQYLDANTIKVTGKRGRPTLAEKVSAVRSHLIDAHKSNQASVENDLKGLEVFSGDPNNIGSANTFNSVVHNMNFDVSSRELKVNWNRLEPSLRWFEGHI